MKTEKYMSENEFKKYLENRTDYSKIEDKIGSNRSLSAGEYYSMLESLVSETYSSGSRLKRRRPKRRS